MREGAIDAGAGVHAAKELLGSVFDDLRRMTKTRLIEWASARYPGVNFSRSHDAQDVMEKIGGMEARSWQAFQSTRRLLAKEHKEQE